MNTNKRRIVGVLLAVLAVAIVPALALANVSLVTRSSAYFADTGATSTSVHLHWPLVVPAIMLLIGLFLILIPRRATAT